MSARPWINQLHDLANEYQGHRRRYEIAMARGKTDKADDAMSEMREMERDVVVIDQRSKREKKGPKT